MQYQYLAENMRPLHNNFVAFHSALNNKTHRSLPSNPACSCNYMYNTEHIYVQLYMYSAANVCGPRAHTLAVLYALCNLSPLLTIGLQVLHCFLTAALKAVALQLFKSC